MSTMAENIMEALINRGYIEKYIAESVANRKEVTALINDVLGLDIEEIDITDINVEPSIFSESVSDLEHKPFRTWSLEDHARFKDIIAESQPVRLICDNLNFKDAEE